MRMSRRWMVAGVAGFVAVAVGAGAVIATQADDAEAPITGPALDRASEAALAFTGEGRVTETEVGDEDSYYEVEVTLNDGSQVDVQLDRDFTVVGSKADAHDDEGGDSGD
jgi:hypothetical protein